MKRRRASVGASLDNQKGEQRSSLSYPSTPETSYCRMEKRKEEPLEPGEKKNNNFLAKRRLLTFITIAGFYMTSLKFKLQNY